MASSYEESVSKRDGSSVLYKAGLEGAGAHCGLSRRGQLARAAHDGRRFRSGIVI
jgi:hypothetical protein